MTVLTWDKPGERVYQTGLDRGVLYTQEGEVAVWNGLIAVEVSSNQELKSFYLDGVKYLETLSPGDFVGKLKAYTYPLIFESINGTVNFATGLVLYDQPPKSFNLSYRTRIGNDLEGTDFGYQIHILYNVVANPDAYALNTLSESGQATEFSWSLTGTPVKISGFRPTMHVSFDSLFTPPEILQILEDKLYGTDTTPPSLPTIQEVAELFGYLGALIIVDLGDGVWRAIDESDTYITMIDATTFQIDGADATYLDPDTYEISSTNVS